MNSFLHSTTFSNQPPRLGARLARADASRGREAMYLDQTPELLARLSHDARVESVTASSAIEGVFIEASRQARVIDAPGPVHLRNRSEKEVRGYRDALDYLVSAGGVEELKVPLVLHIHRLLFSHTDSPGGQLKTADNRIVANDPDRGRRTIFEPPPFQRTEFVLTELLARYASAAEEEIAHPLALIGAFAVDFLAIHPFADGNGRMARLLTNHLLLSQGYGVVRYVSLEQRIYESRNHYYDALEDAQRGWHEGEHQVWPFVELLTARLQDSYARFEQRIAAARDGAGGSKQDRVRRYVLNEAPARFTKALVRRSVPGVSDPTISNVLRALQVEGLVRNEGVGRSASWRRA
jgi:Fic family protein